MSKQYENVQVSAGRDYNRAGKVCEYVVMAEVGDDDWIILERKSGFSSKAQAQKAGLKAGAPYQAPVLL